jgi:superoxide dismutase, Cu-Zn family
MEEIMYARTFLMISALLCASVAFSQDAPKSAHADIMDAQGRKVGTARITAAADGVSILVNVEKLPPGTHGIHIHTIGKCEGPAFTTAGGHFNPDMKKHGKDNPDGPHVGDLLNLEIGADGAGKATLHAMGVTLGDGPNSLFHDGGTAIVIHATADDYKTDPSGNSGARIACGVIEK